MPISFAIAFGFDKSANDVHAVWVSLSAFKWPVLKIYYPSGAGTVWRLIQVSAADVTLDHFGVAPIACDQFAFLVIAQCKAEAVWLRPDECYIVVIAKPLGPPINPSSRLQVPSNSWDLFAIQPARGGLRWRGGTSP
jgi:hypothetical protein